MESPKEKEKNYSYCTSGAGVDEGMKQPDPAGGCTREDACGCSSAETRGVIPRERTPVPAEESERIVPTHTDDLQNMRSPAARDRDVHPTISPINPAEFRPVDLFSRASSVEGGLPPTGRRVRRNGREKNPNLPGCSVPPVSSRHDNGPPRRSG